MYDLDELALETGSTVAYTDGRKFNTAGIQGKRLMRGSKPEPEPAPMPAPAPRQELTPELMQQILAAINRPVEVKLPTMPTPQVTVAAPAKTQAPTKWTFEFERNPNGTIKRINATSEA
jgi:hypothetical protein